MQFSEEHWKKNPPNLLSGSSVFLDFAVTDQSDTHKKVREISEKKIQKSFLWRTLIPEHLENDQWMVNTFMKGSVTKISNQLLSSP